MLSHVTENWNILSMYIIPTLLETIVQQLARILARFSTSLFLLIWPLPRRKLGLVWGLINLLETDLGDPILVTSAYVEPILD